MKFSEKEINDLLKAWIAISLAFAILLNQGNIMSESFSKTLIMSSITVGTAFLLHELGHKFVAQKYHFWAEFRAFNGMLILAILMSFLGFIFIAPGAVMIHGHFMTREKNGKISAAGPLVNFILAVLFVGLLALGINNQLTNYGAFINSLIGLFNMLPFWNIDGKKILNWSKPVYFSMISAGFLLLFLSSMFGTI
jgi:Zn-dependent protease|tara:strand:- start:215 stop:799 length:585 start_codon:yes stop_codon:yes gene_type:complete